VYHEIGCTDSSINAMRDYVFIMRFRNMHVKMEDPREGPAAATTSALRCEKGFTSRPTHNSESHLLIITNPS